MGANNLYYPSTERVETIIPDNYIVIDDKKTGLPLKIDLTNFFARAITLGLIPVRGETMNTLYSADDVIVTPRTVNGAGNALTFTNLGATAIRSNGDGIDIHDTAASGRIQLGANVDITTANNVSIVSGGNLAINVIGTTNINSTGDTSIVSAGALYAISTGNAKVGSTEGVLELITSTANAHININTHTDGAFVVSSSLNPDTDITAPENGMVKYGLTANQWRFFENGAWRTFGTTDLYATRNTALLANTANSFAAEVAAAGIVEIRSIQVVDLINDQLITHAVEVKPAAMTVTSNTAYTSIRILINGR